MSVMREYIRLLEGEVISMNDSVQKRLRDLNQAAGLIEQAIELEDGTQATMRKIVDVMHGRWEQTGEDDFHFKRMAETKPLRQRAKLGQEKLQTYSELLVLIRREIAKLNEGGAIVQATELAAKFKQQHSTFLALRAALRRQSWWNKDVKRRARCVELCRQIEERMHKKRILATKLIEMLRDEVKSPTVQ